MEGAPLGPWMIEVCVVLDVVSGCLQWFQAVQPQVGAHSTVAAAGSAGSNPSSSTLMMAKLHFIVLLSAMHMHTKPPTNTCCCSCCCCCYRHEPFYAASRCCAGPPKAAARNLQVWAAGMPCCCQGVPHSWLHWRLCQWLLLAGVWSAGCSLRAVIDVLVAKLIT
jgi:hypothetical protein